eukprot:SAG11_NODE_5213_length_1628_cov_1.510137_1_plen_183_part_00
MQNLGPEIDTPSHVPLRSRYCPAYVLNCVLRCLASDSGRSALVLGGVDQRYCAAGDCKWGFHKLDLAQALLGYWLIKGTDIQANGKSLDICRDHNCQFVVDTGTSIIVGPTNRIGPLLSLVNASGAIAGDGTMPCALEKRLPVSLLNSHRRRRVEALPALHRASCRRVHCLPTGFEFHHWWH